MTSTATKQFPVLLMERPQWQPENDGVDHINIFKDAATDLGRKLQHFAVTPFVHPLYGPFKSMEGFWHYIKGAEPDDNFRTLIGTRNKVYAASRRKVRRDNFVEIITEANYQKVIQNEHIKQMMLDSELPFAYYYLHGPGKVQIFPEQSSWLCSGFEKIRLAVKAGTEIPSEPLVQWERRN